MKKIGRNDLCPCNSGKKYKQCCLRVESQIADRRSEVAPEAISIPKSLQIAFEHHKAGRLSQAEVIYRQVLQIKQNHPEALHMLGSIAYQVGDNDMAVELINKAIQSSPSNPDYYSNIGLVYRKLNKFDKAVACHQRAIAIKPNYTEAHHNLGLTLKDQGKLNEAVSCFRRAIAIKPNYAEAHHNLGLTLKDQGKLNEAVSCYQRAIAIKPDYAEVHHNLGITLTDMGKLDEAVSCYQRAIAIKPDYAEALNNLGITLADMNKIDEAVSCYQRAIAIKPDYAEVHHNLGLALKDQGKLDEAIICCQQAIHIAPSNELFWVEFSESLKTFRSDILDQIHQPILLMALKKKNLNPQNLERFAAALICRDPLVQHLLAVATGSGEAVQQLGDFLSDGRIKPFIEMPLLLAVLEETRNTNYDLEKLLTILRHILLMSVLRSEIIINNKSVERFLSSLALQCFANEYVYSESEEERRLVASLVDKIFLALQKGEQFPAVWLMLAGSYQALHRLGFTEEEIQALDLPEDYIQTVIQRQFVEPKQEERISKEIKRLTSIGDSVSQAVRQQYEENPYPRWERLSKPHEGTTHDVLRKLFPQQAIPDTSTESPLILVAGCGTGQNSVQVALRFKNARVTAIDLSMPSLAYAKRITQELGITNIEYQQADILELNTLSSQFDLIECIGVLHHMNDPLEGWRILVNLLRPGGYMKLGLYSRRARHIITTTRQLINQRGYPSTAEGIRRFRQEIMTGDSAFANSIWSLTSDFYSTSTCRDLLFHVQEHQFSPSEIQSHLVHSGLKFIGFELSAPEAIRRYKARFPEDIACDVLTNWELFEEDNPYLFAGMYQFWVRKDFASL